MKKIIGLIIVEIIWAAVCLFGWLHAVFFGFPKDSWELKMYVPVAYTISVVLGYAIPIIWLIIAIVIAYKWK